MSRKLTASDRSALIRLASTMPVGSPERKAILASLNWQSGGSRIDSMTDGFGGEDFHWEGSVAGKPLKMTIEMGYDGQCDLYVHHGGRWLKTKKQYSLRAAKRLAEIVLDALESGEVSNPWYLEHRGQEIFTQVRSASAQSGLSKVSFAPPKRKGKRVRIMREVASWVYRGPDDPDTGVNNWFPLPVGTMGVVTHRGKNYGRAPSDWHGAGSGGSPGGGHEYHIEFIDPMGNTSRVTADDSDFLQGRLK